MDYFYDNQLRRYITQFMRIFIGFKYENSDKEQRVVPVTYGDMSRQVASVIRENSENKITDVPRLGCYVSGLKMDHKRISDSSFVSKVHLRERKWNDEDSTNQQEFQNTQGGNYTVERLMPTPFELTVKADLWTSNTDQKLQLIEQMLVLFNPSLEIQTTDNYLDWTSLTIVDLDDLNYSSRSIPQGVDADIDICTMTFKMPIWINPPAKVKKLGIIKSIISNVFTESGSVAELEDLTFNNMDDPYPMPMHGDDIGFSNSSYNFSVLLMKSDNANSREYEVSIVNPDTTVVPLIVDIREPSEVHHRVDWQKLIEVLGGYKQGSRIAFKQLGHELVGNFAINPLDPNFLSVQFDIDTLPQNSSIDINGYVCGIDELGNIYESLGFDATTAKQTVDLIVDPQTFNPITKFNGLTNIPYNTRLMILNAIGDDDNVDGADAWAEYHDNANPSDSTKTYDLVAPADSIIAWNGTRWVIVFNPIMVRGIVPIIQNMNTMVKYKFVDADGWVKAFEGEYEPSSWTLLLES